MDDQVERVGDVAFDGPIREFNSLWSTQLVKRLSAWAAELAWTVESVPECPVLRSCSKSNASGAANLSEHDSVGPVPEARLEELPDGYGGKYRFALAGLRSGPGWGSESEFPQYLR